MSDVECAAGSLGKRKRKEGVDSTNDGHGSTLFVSNLPYTATSTDLKTLFSDLAPVRSAFVVLEGETSKGVGYVSFAIKEDATAAMATIEKDGVTLDGRTLRVQWAGRKVVKDAKSGEATEPKIKVPAPRPSISKPAKDPNAIRTIVISGLPPSVDQKALWKKVRKVNGAESVELSEVAGVAHALFVNASAAVHAVEKLHAHVFKGSLLSVSLKKRLETLSKTIVKGGASASAANPAPSRGSRLIIRNLPWNISEHDLRALFLPFGPIYSIHIPSSPAEEGKKNLAKGFAFVWFFSKKDAERAIAGVNGLAVSAGAVTAPTMNKKERARLRRRLREQERSAAGQEGEGSAEEGEDGDGDEASEAGSAHPAVKKEEARVVAVDWALSKERWEEAKAKGGAEAEAEDGEDASEEDGESSSASSEASETSDEEGESAASGSDEEDDEMDVDGGEVQSDEEVHGRPTLPQTDVGTTLFVRNVPYDATEDELRTLFRAFGPLRYARITMDHESGRSRGTAFACFWKKEDADKAIRQSEILSRETGMDNAPKKNPFSLPSILTPDPSSSLAQSLVLHGRTLDVSRAVTRDEASRLKDEGERQREKADKRNLYLLREGVIFPNTPAAATLSVTELEKRNASFTTRRTLLKSNPLLYISKTRLSVRQLPMFTTERSLKRLAIHAVRAFEEEVKAGSRPPLTADELREEDTPLDLGAADKSEDEDGERGQNQAAKKGKGKGKKPARDTGVKQAKIVRQSDRVEPISGKGKSKGYGFLEMSKHADALRVLRWANNSPAVGELLAQWWRAEVEEMVVKLEAEGRKGEMKKTEKGEEAGAEDSAARLARAKGELSRLKSGEGKKSKGTLVIEFSIENAQVVNRRKAAAQNVKAEPGSATSLRSPSGEDMGRQTKRRKVSSTPSDDKPRLSLHAGVKKKTESGERDKAGGLGGIIGRKRRERKMPKRTG